MIVPPRGYEPRDDNTIRTRWISATVSGKIMARCLTHDEPPNPPIPLHWIDHSSSTRADNAANQGDSEERR